MRVWRCMPLQRLKPSAFQSLSFSSACSVQQGGGWFLLPLQKPRTVWRKQRNLKLQPEGAVEATLSGARAATMLTVSLCPLMAVALPAWGH